MCNHEFEGRENGVKCRLCGFSMTAEEYAKEYGKAAEKATKKPKRKAVKKDE
nr:MAG TPA: hypothetical protein [Caudoviricetes sp.]